MDTVDYKILEILQKNSKISNIKIAKEIGLTAPSTLERVRKLEESGIVEGYYTNFDKEMLDYKITCFVSVTLTVRSKENITDFLTRIEKMPQITESYLVTGKYDYLLKVYAHDVADLQNFLLNELTLSNVSQAETLLILDEHKFGIDFKHLAEESKSFNMQTKNKK